MKLIALASIFLLGPMAGVQAQNPGHANPPGDAKTTKTRTLSTGAKIIQSHAPLDQLTLYLSGFHTMKDNPQEQIEASHYCRQVNQDFAQCVLFDSESRDANLTGVEYIISEKLFNSLPAEEKQYWHPHNYEIFSGELVAPGLPDSVEKTTLKDKINSYGKTWHLWASGTPGSPPQSLPLGPPHLAWSFNHDGEVKPELVKERDSRLKVNTTEKRNQRADMAPLAHPQQGVDAIRSAFPNADGAPAGVKAAPEK
jgi:hypothetical protein